MAAKAAAEPQVEHPNGDVIDDPCVNGFVVGVDLVSGAGNVPDPEPEPEPEPPDPEEPTP